MLAALLMVSLSAASGCILHHHDPVMTPPSYAQGYGPPPHAPAHGYRHKHHGDGVNLVFDAGLGVYVVADWPDYYWHVDRYLRWAAGEWRVSSRIDGTWVVVASDRVPAKLVAKHAKHRKKAHRHGKRDSAPAKHDH
jgi:hypothetical protein